MYFTVNTLFKTILFVTLFAWVNQLSANSYHPWIEKQLALIYQSNEENMSEKKLSEIIQEHNRLYDEALESLLRDKALLLSRPQHYEKEVFKLQKMITIYKRVGNAAAVLQNEVKVKSYQLIIIQNNMIREIFKALESDSIDTYESKLYDIFTKSQKAISDLDDKNYNTLIQSNTENSMVKEIKKNIRELYALKEVNADVVRYLSSEVKKTYRLHKYAHFHILEPVLYINHQKWVQKVNEIIKPYGFSVVKVLLMLFISLFIYFIRKVLLGLIEKILIRIKGIGHYAKEIINDIHTPISLLLLVINFELILLIYNESSSYETASKFFNIIYIVFFTYILLETLNSIARVKLEYMDKDKQKIRNELFNLTIKIINFIIAIIGFLFILQIWGLDLSTALSGLGIGGFAVALAARESLSNFFGTISILMSDVFSQGDWIAVDGREGHVVEIGLRVTTIRTFDNAIIAIPNATLANHEVKNWSKRIVGRRIKMKLGLKYNSKRKDLQNAVEEIREMLRHHPDIATDKTMYQERKKKSAKLVSKEDELGVKRTLLVYLDEFSDSSINILVYAFSKSTVWNDWLKTKEDVMYQMMEILERNHLEFAFPTVTLDGVERH